MPICRGCHDAKDRLSTRDVDPGVIFLAIRGLWEKADRAERIMICSILDAMQDAAYVVARKGRRPTVKELEALDSLRDEDIDYSDIPRMDT